MDTLNFVSLFALGFSSIFPLVNPVGTALIINPFYANSSLQERKSLTLKVLFYSLILGVSTLFLGSWCLKAMGISIPTTQMAGGLIIARMGLGLLNSSGDDSGSVSTKGPISKSLFYPITFPLTIGPGCISALITLSAHAHSEDVAVTMMSIGILTGSLIAVLFVTYFFFTYSDLVIRKIGETGSLVLNRLMAFLVFCIGIQMIVSGFSHTFPKLIQ